MAEAALAGVAILAFRRRRTARSPTEGALSGESRGA